MNHERQLEINETDRTNTYDGASFTTAGFSIASNGEMRTF